MSDKKLREHYLGNPNLPTINSSFEYTPEMIKELEKCGKDILHFASTYFHIINLDEGRQTIKLHKCQKRALKKMMDNRYFILLASRQIGKTTLLTIYALWYACFHKDQKVLIVANKEGTAKEIFSRIRLAYEDLPNWLKPGVTEYGKESMGLTNGSAIGISTTTGTAARGMSVSLLILDELAFIEPHIVEQFWKSVFPIISSSKKSKIFIASTANGTDNLFYEIYSKAEAGTNNWAYDKILWNEIPGRTITWRREQILALGSEEAFDQEFGCKFLQTGETAVDEVLAAHMKKTIRHPTYLLDDGNYHVFEEPKQDGVYVIGVDVAEGMGDNASVMQILNLQNLNKITQAAVYRDKDISPMNLSKKIYEIALQWGNPVLAIERNNCGAEVIDQLYHNYNYTNMLHYSYGSGTKGKQERKGIVSHSNLKFKGVMNKRYWLKEKRSVIIYDEQTFKELKDFVRYPNGTWKARPGVDVYDDHVLALIWGLLVLDNDIVERHFIVEQFDENKKPLIIKPYFTPNFGNLGFSSMFNGLPYNQGGMPQPFVFNAGEETNDDIEELKAMGFTFLDNRRY